MRRRCGRRRRAVTPGCAVGDRIPVGVAPNRAVGRLLAVAAASSAASGVDWSCSASSSATRSSASCAGSEASRGCAAEGGLGAAATVDDAIAVAVKVVGFGGVAGVVAVRAVVPAQPTGANMAAPKTSDATTTPTTRLPLTRFRSRPRPRSPGGLKVPSAEARPAPPQINHAHHAVNHHPALAEMNSARMILSMRY